jgi:hypothetical protein
MECKDIQDELSPYLEGLMPPEERETVAAHLSACEKCSMALTELRKATTLLKGLEEVEPPPWLTQKIMATVREEGQKKAGLLRALFYPLHIKVPVQVLGVILIGVVAFQIYRVTEPEMKPMQAPVPPVVSSTEQKKVLKEEAQGVSPKPNEVSPAPAKQPIAQGMKGAEKDQKAPERYAVHDGEKRVSTDETRASTPKIGEGIPATPEAITEDKAKAPLAGKVMEPEVSPSYPAAGLAKEPRLRAGLQSMPVIVIAGDSVSSAQTAVEDILKQLGAKEIERITEGTALVMTLELPSEKIKELTDRLTSVGDVKTTPSLPDLREGAIRLRLEIIPR